MSTKPIIARETLVLRISVPGEFVVERGMMVTLASDPGQKGVVFDLKSHPKPIIRIAWFNGASQGFETDQFSKKCRLTGTAL